MEDCLFCKIATHQIPVEAVYEDDESLVFPDLHPQAPTHLLVIQKVHFSNAAEAPPQQLGVLLGVAASTGKRLLPQGYRIVINTGGDGGQTVHHLHLHLLGGRPMLWPPG